MSNSHDNWKMGIQWSQILDTRWTMVVPSPSQGHMTLYFQLGDTGGERLLTCVESSAAARGEAGKVKSNKRNTKTLKKNGGGIIHRSHRRGACRVQHTHMPAYGAPYNGSEYQRRGRVAPVTQRTRPAQAHLRLLHLVLGVHLRDDFIHVGLQHHSAHHHLCQNVVDLRERCTCVI